MMSGFGKLPRELLDHAVDIALVQERAVPSADTVDTDKSRIAHKYSQNAFKTWGYGPPHVLWENTAYVSNAAPLLLVNRFWHESTKAAVHRLAKADEGLVYKLDVMFVHERAIWPTWICVPALSTLVGRVEVTIRIVGSHETARAASNGSVIRSGLLGGCGGPPQILWCFYYLMEHYLIRGPRPLSQRDEDIDRCVVTRRIEVNFAQYDGPLQLPREISMVGVWWSSRRSRTVQELHSQPMRREWLLNFLLNNFKGLLGMGYHSARYGGIIFERIGSIKFSAEGYELDDTQRLRSEYKLGEILKEIDHRDPSSTFGNVWPRAQRVPAWKAWKAYTLQQREQYRLDVAVPVEYDAVDQVHDDELVSTH